MNLQVNPESTAAESIHMKGEPMIIEQGIVEEIRGRKALVRIRKSAACAGCPTRDSCEIGSDKPVRVEVVNDLSASVGDLVEISMPAATVMKLSLLIYFFPVLALVAGAVIGNSLAGFLGMGPTPAAMAGGGGAMAATFLGLRRLEKRTGTRERYRPRMTRVLPGGDPEPSAEEENGASLQTPEK